MEGREGVNDASAVATSCKSVSSTAGLTQDHGLEVQREGPDHRHLHDLSARHVGLLNLALALELVVARQRAQARGAARQNVGRRRLGQLLGGQQRLGRSETVF